VASRLDRALPVALHEQIADAIRDEIRSGAWPPQFRLPAEPELAESLRVSRGTLRKSLQTLLDEGMLTRVQGRGTFVAPSGIEQSIGQELLSLAEGLERGGVMFETRVISAQIEPAPERVAGLIGLRAGDPVFYMRRVRSIGGSPVAYLVNYVPAASCPGIELQDFSVKTLFGVLENDYGLEISVGRRTFEAQAAFGVAAQTLEVPVGTPVLYLEQVVYLGDGRPVEYSDVWIRGDRLRLTSLLSRRRRP
jgi:DNA-binding GntR family transcriptional regulator